jgi:hypothetical protein
LCQRCCALTRTACCRIHRRLHYGIPPTASNIPCEIGIRGRAIPNTAAPTPRPGTVAAPSARRPKPNGRPASHKNRLPKQIPAPAHSPPLRKPAEAALGRPRRRLDNKPRHIQPKRRFLAVRQLTTTFENSPLYSPFTNNGTFQNGFTISESTRLALCAGSAAATCSNESATRSIPPGYMRKRRA